MKTVSFFGHDVTRLILGDNPFNGHSYIQDRVDGEEMKAYYTRERVLETLFDAEKLGINTMLPLACPKILELLPEYYDRGGGMQIIFQPYPAEPVEENLEKMMQFKPIGIYHQGTTTDYLNETGQKETIIKNMKIYKTAGVPVGLGSHVPETIMQCEEEGWGADFYMTCLYNARRNRRGEQSGFITGKSKADLIFYPDDRFLMYKVIQKLQKPCIAFKIFAGGQIFAGKKEDEYETTAETMLREVYANIKPGDAVAIGVFQRDMDLLEQDIALVDKI
ncbi:MAG: hypothetical protein LBG22_00435 [Treponema sp.]|jgi:hypothetical protein|nr:hypothetical protein [Treponema sp.]